MNRTEMNALLSEKAKGKATKGVLINIPNSLYVETMAKQGRLLSEAAAKGETSRISITTVVLDALRAFVAE